MLAKPEGGWKQNTFYFVEVAWNINNPIHPAIFYSGFLDSKGNPDGYSCIFNPTYDCVQHHEYLDGLAYFSVIREIISGEEWKVKERNIRLPSEVLNTK